LGLMQGRRVAITRRGLFQDLIQSAGVHSKHFITEAGLATGGVDRSQKARARRNPKGGFLDNF
jgi:hypothetical protein